MRRFDDWIDEECRNMTIALSMTPERPSAETQEMVGEFRKAMKRSYQGQCLLLADQFEELWRALPWPLRKPIEGVVWVNERIERLYERL